jgi:hypothetical protein
MFDAKAPKKTMRNVRWRRAEIAFPVARGLSPSTTASSISSMEGVAGSELPGTGGATPAS